MLNILGGFLCAFLVSAGAWFYERFVFIHKKNIPADRSALVPFLASTFPLLLIVLIVKVSVLEFFVVNSNSMQPQLKKDDVVLVSKWEPWIIKGLLFLNQKSGFYFNRSDIVLFKSPIKDVAANVTGEMGLIYEPLVKRVVLRPYDRFVIDDGSTIWREYRYTLATEATKGCRKIDQSIFCLLYPELSSQSGANKLQIKLDPKTVECQSLGSRKLCSVSEGFYFLIGDNAWFSKDSRHFGLINEKMITGKVVALPGLFF